MDEVKLTREHRLHDLIIRNSQMYLCAEILAIKSGNAVGSPQQIDKVNGHIIVQQRKANLDAGRTIKRCQLLRPKTAVGARPLI